MNRRAAHVLLGLLVLVSLAGNVWFGAATPDASRWWDEIYPLENVWTALEGGTLRPINGWYPQLAHLPQTAVLAISRWLGELTGADALRVTEPKRGFTATAYRLCRWTNALFGAAALVLTFLIGQRLFSREVGLVAALLHAAAPWHIVASGYFKPDALLVLLCSLAWLWSLEAVERGGLRGYLVAGLGIGLAGAAKQLGVFASIPLVAATLLRPRDPRRWLGLAAAGLASIVVFNLINPFPGIYLRFAARQHAFMTEREPVSFFSMLAFQAGLPPSPGFHGWLFGALALAGLAGLAVACARGRADDERTQRLVMFLSFPLGLAVALALVSNYPKDNLSLPILPFTSLAAAWVLAAAWGWVAPRLAAGLRRWVLAIGLPSLLLVPAWHGAQYTYVGAVPETTRTEAARLAARQIPFLEQRSCVVESAWSGGAAFERALRPRAGLFVWVEAVPRLIDVEPAGLDLADCEVFPAARLSGPDGEAYLDHMLRVGPGQARILEPRFLRSRGEAQVVLFHPWRPAAGADAIAWNGNARRRTRKLTGWLSAEVPRGQIVSFDLAWPESGSPLCELTLDGRPLEIFQYALRRGENSWMTRRLAVPRAQARVVLTCPEKLDPASRPRLDLWPWTR